MVVVTREIPGTHVTELCGILLPEKTAALRPSTGKEPPAFVKKQLSPNDQTKIASRLVCVTSATSYVGLAIVHRLLSRGYTVRAAVDSLEDLRKLREMEESTNFVGVVVDVMNLESVSAAIDGCAAVFHTSSFVDPGGVSGYTKSMADVEAMGAENVVEACARTSSIQKCVITSSLLSCVCQRESFVSFDRALDESFWSDEDLLRERKLWFALGKTMMEKAAWKRARGKKIKLVTICPGLVTGPGFQDQCPSTAIAYLKGGNEMYRQGTLAIVDVDKVAEAHVSVYETFDASGRYICFNHVVNTRAEALEIERQVRGTSLICSGLDIEQENNQHHQLLNGKLARLMTRTSRCSLDTYQWIFI